jgi:hypothetical protein
MPTDEYRPTGAALARLNAGRDLCALHTEAEPGSATRLGRLIGLGPERAKLVDLEALERLPDDAGGA